MEQEKTRTTAADFFIYFGILIGLYASSVSLISICFDLINKWLPDVSSYYGDFSYSNESIRFALAVLIIFFPAFLYLSKIATKAITVMNEKKDMWVRRWFYFLTLFLTGLAIAVDLATLVYRFIGGEDLTLRFILKVLVVLLVTIAIFRFYLYELRRDVTLPTPKRKYLMYISVLVFLVIIIVAIVNIGSPTTQRQIRFDQTRLNDLSSIQNSVTEYYRANNGILPSDLIILSQSTYYYGFNLKDPETGLEYEYKVTSQNEYQLCATFSTDNKVSKPREMTYPDSEIWKHGIGKVCFDRIAGEAVPKY